MKLEIPGINSLDVRDLFTFEYKDKDKQSAKVEIKDLSNLNIASYKDLIKCIDISFEIWNMDDHKYKLQFFNMFLKLSDIMIVNSDVIESTLKHGLPIPFILFNLFNIYIIDKKRLKEEMKWKWVGLKTYEYSKGLLAPPKDVEVIKLVRKYYEGRANKTYKSYKSFSKDVNDDHIYMSTFKAIHKRYCSYINNWERKFPTKTKRVL